MLSVSAISAVATAAFTRWPATWAGARPARGPWTARARSAGAWTAGAAAAFTRASHAAVVFVRESPLFIAIWMFPSWHFFLPPLRLRFALHREKFAERMPLEW